MELRSIVGKSVFRPSAIALALAALVACTSANEPGLRELPLHPTSLVPPLSTPFQVTPTIQEIPEVRPTEAVSRGLAARLVRETTVDGAMAMMWSPDGTTIALTTSDGVVLLDASTLGQVAAHATDHVQNALAFSSDGNRLATADHWEQGRWIRLWDASDLALLQEHDLPAPASIMQLGFRPNGDLALAAGEPSGLALWTVSPDSGMNRLFAIERAEPLTSSLDPLHGMVAVSVGPAEAVQIWDLNSARMLDEAPLVGALRLEFTHDGRQILALLDFAAVTWNIQESRVESRVPIADGAISNLRVPFSLAITRDGKVFAAGTEIPSTGIGVWDVQTGQLIGVMPHDELGNVISFSFSPANGELAILLRDGGLQVWDIALTD